MGLAGASKGQLALLMEAVEQGEQELDVFTQHEDTLSSTWPQRIFGAAERPEPVL